MMKNWSAVKASFSRTKIVLLVLLSIVVGGLVWRYATHTATLLAYPYEWDEDEGYHINFAKRLLHHQPIYGDINQVPMHPLTYPPVHAAVLTPFVWALGAKLFAGRLVSLLAIAGLAVLVLAIVRQETGRWILGGLAAAFVIGSPYLTAWGPLCRVDSLMLLFLFAGLFFVRQYPRSLAALPTGLALLVLACYTKQQAVLLVPAAFVHVWRINRRTALWSVACFAVAGFAILIGLQYWSGGNFWRNTVDSQATQFIFDLIGSRSGDFLALHGLLVAGATGWLVYQLNKNWRALDFWSVFALTTLPFGVLAGKNGATFHYFLSPAIAVTICTVLALDRLWQTLPTGWPKATVGQMMILLLLLQGVIFWCQPIHGPTEADRQAGDRLLNVIRETKGDLFMERRDIFPVLTGHESQADFCLLYFLYHQDLERAATAQPPGSYHGQWNPQTLVQAVRDKRYSLVVIEPKFVPDVVMNEITANYKKVDGPPIVLGTWYGHNTYVLGVPK